MGRPRDQPPAPKQTAPPSYLAPYLDALDAHGATFEATLWNSREWQQRRFEVLAAMADLRDRHILDCGCGLGDLAEFLTRRAIAYASYTGLEALPELVAAARRRNLPRANFVGADFVAEERAMCCECDAPAACATGASAAAGAPSKPGAHAPPTAIIFCGSLNTIEPARALATLEHAWKALAPAPKRPGAAAPVLLFNFLSDARSAHAGQTDDTGPALRHNARKFFDWALTQTPSVAFRSDYLPGGHDATIAMWR